MFICQRFSCHWSFVSQQVMRTQLCGHSRVASSAESVFFSIHVNVFSFLCPEHVKVVLGGRLWAHKPSPLPHLIFFSPLITGMFLQDLPSAATTLTSNLYCHLLLTHAVMQTLVLLVYILHYSEVTWWWIFLFLPLFLPFRSWSWDWC